MSLVFGAEQEDLRRTVRDFLADTSPTARVRWLMETRDGLDRAAWERMANELGLHGLAIPEEYGGAGFGPVEQVVVFEELGRAAFCGPFFGTVALVASALLAAEDESAAKDLLPGIADGSTTAALAFTEDDGKWEPDATALDAQRSGSSYTLTGHKNFVIDGAAANLFLVIGRTARGLSLFAVDADAPGLHCAPLETLDRTRKQVRLEFAGVGARLVGDEGQAGATLDRALDRAAMLLAVEQVGGAQACLDMTVDYAKMRSQFGRKIGSFQAVKHRCADMLVAVESARAAAYQAGWAAAHSPDEFSIAAAMAKAVASEAYVFCATETIQLHGGIGFTWEHDAHLYYRRAHSTALLLGDAAYQRELLGRRLSI